MGISAATRALLLPEKTGRDREGLRARFRLEDFSTSLRLLNHERAIRVKRIKQNN